MITASEDRRGRVQDHARDISSHYAELVEVLAAHLPAQLLPRNKIIGILHQMLNVCDLLKKTAESFEGDERDSVLTLVFLCSDLSNSLLKGVAETHEASWTQKISEIINPVRGKREKQPSIKPGVIIAKANALVRSLGPKLDYVFAGLPQDGKPVLRATATKLVNLCRELETSIGKENPEAADALIGFITLMYGILAGMKRSLR